MAFIPILPFRWNLYLPSICFHSLKFRLSHCIEEIMTTLLTGKMKKYPLIMETESNLDFDHLLPWHYSFVMDFCSSNFGFHKRANDSGSVCCLVWFLYSDYEMNRLNKDLPDPDSYY